MTPESENFDALRRLLKLKRHEQPPPGYFNDFSRHVVAQIRAGRAGGSEQALDRLSWEAPWLQRLMEAFQAKPTLAVGFGAAVCALLVGGVIYSESLEAGPPPLFHRVEDLAGVTAAPHTTAPVFPLPETGVSALLAAATNHNANPLIQPGGSLFDAFPNLVSPQRASGKPLGQ